MQIFDFQDYIKVSGISGFFTALGTTLNLLKFFAEMQTKKAVIESKRLTDFDFPAKKRTFPVCIERDLNTAPKTTWFQQIRVLIVLIIVFPLIYSFFKNVSVQMGNWYFELLAILSYVTAFGPLLYVLFIISKFASLYIRLTKYENAVDLHKYNCK